MQYDGKILTFWYLQDLQDLQELQDLDWQTDI